MSNRSYPADFSRPLREVPVATDADVQRMLERLRRRCKVGKVSVNGSVAQRESAEASEVVGSNPAGTANLAPASSAGHPSPASASVVSGAAGITATAGGGPHEAGVNASPPFQSTRPAPIEEVMRNDPRSAGESKRLHQCLQPGNRNVDAGINASAENTLNGPGRQCEVDTDVSIALSRPALQWERISPTAMRTTCGTWTCCRVTIGGIHSYELWRRVAGMERSIPVPPSFPSFDQARQAAQDEMDAENGKAQP